MYLCSPNFSMNMQEDKSIIEVSHVSKYFGEKTALDDVSLNVKKGEFVTILGPSGCGKTTFLKTLNGPLEQERGVNVSGRIMLEEADIHSLSMEELRKNVGLVFQTPAPFPFSIYKNLTYAPVYYGIRDKKSWKRL